MKLRMKEPLSPEYRGAAKKVSALIKMVHQ